VYPCPPSDAPLDFRIKSNLVADLLSLAGKPTEHTMYIVTYYIFHTTGVVVQDTYSGEVKKKHKDSVAECKNRVKPILVKYV